MIIGGAILAVVLFIVVFIVVIPALQTGSSTEPSSKITLTVWGVDDENYFSAIETSYTAAHPNVAISYVQYPEDKYENALLNAMALGKGPDIFMIHRSWIDRQGNKMSPVSESQFPFVNIRNLFPQIVENDFTYKKTVYALPLYLDTLALVANRDQFNIKGIAVQPTTWGDIKTLIPYFTQFGSSHQLQKSAITLGGSLTSFRNAPDLLSLLMLQYGDKSLSSLGETVSGGRAADQNALSFYTQFASPQNQYYTWDDKFGSDFDAFANGDAAMTFAYARQLDDIRKKNPTINLSVIPMPQENPSSPVNYADYWGLTVSKQSQNARFAWQFIIDLTTNPTSNSQYLQASNRPPALLTSINQYFTNPDLGVFAKQSLTAQAPYEYDHAAYRRAFSDMIQSTVSGNLTIINALNKAADNLKASS